MRGTKAKRLRREVYGDYSTKSEARKYMSVPTVINPDAPRHRRSYAIGDHFIIADDRRRLYQHEKGR